MGIVDRIRAHLATAGNVVRLSTALRSVVYSDPAAFKTDKAGSAYVRRGNRWDCFATASQILVAVRFGRITEGR